MGFRRNARRVVVHGDRGPAAHPSPTAAEDARPTDQQSSQRSVVSLNCRGLSVRKGALIWRPDLDAWTTEMARLIRPGGHLFIHEGHPATELWTWDLDKPRIRSDRDYFGRSFVRMGDVDAAAFRGRLPNSFALLARCWPNIGR